LPSPAPFVFHPELFPDLAGYNPEPADFVIPRPRKKRITNPQKLSCSVVENPDASTGFIDVSKLMNQETWNKYKGFAYDKIDQQKIDSFQDDLAISFQDKIQGKIKKEGVMYQNE
jgi:hypothetical protein